MIDSEVYPKFSFDTLSHNIIITSGVYNNTTFKIKRIRFEDDILKYNVEIIELHASGGRIEHPHGYELEHFINTETPSIVKRLLKMSAALRR